jgi:hypothetical protein
VLSIPEMGTETEECPNKWSVPRLSKSEQFQNDRPFMLTTYE